MAEGLKCLKHSLAFFFGLQKVKFITRVKCNSLTAGSFKPSGQFGVVVEKKELGGGVLQPGVEGALAQVEVWVVHVKLAPDVGHAADVDDPGGV